MRGSVRLELGAKVNNPMSTTMVHVRIDQRVKDRATKALATMGLSVSDAVRMMLVRVAAEDALPFEVRVPNSTTVKAMEAADRGEGRRFSSPEALLKDLGADSGRCRSAFRTDVDHCSEVMPITVPK